MPTYEIVLDDYPIGSELIEENHPHLAETPAIVDTSPTVGDFSHDQDEIGTVLDGLGVGWDFTISDTASDTSTVLIEVAVLVQDLIDVLDTALISGTYNPVISDLITVLDSLLGNQALDDSLAESYIFSDSLVNAFYAIQSLDEVLSLSESVSLVGDISETLAETLSIIDTVLRAFLESVSDTISTAESLINILILKSLIADAASELNTTSAISILNHAVTDSPELTDITTNEGNFLELVLDGYEISTKISLDGEIYQCWVLTTDEFKISSYTDFNFNSFANAQGKLFGAKEDGIYEISPSFSDDDGTVINTGVQFNFEALKDLHGKRFRKAYIGSEGNNTILKVEDGSGNIGYYSVDRKQVTIGKDLQSRRYKFSLRSITSIDHIEFHPILLDKNR